MPVVDTSDFSITVLVIGVHYSYITPHALSSDLLAGYSVMNMLSHNRHYCSTTRYVKVKKPRLCCLWVLDDSIKMAGS